MADVHGWFYHFLDIRSGTRYGNSEVSTRDSTWLVAGALTARQYFRESPQIAQLATAIYERVDYRQRLSSERLRPWIFFRTSLGSDLSCLPRSMQNARCAWVAVAEFFIRSLSATYAAHSMGYLFK